jgi:hypothetical protein
MIHSLKDGIVFSLENYEIAKHAALFWPEFLTSLEEGSNDL